MRLDSAFRKRHRRDRNTSCSLLALHFDHRARDWVDSHIALPTRDIRGTDWQLEAYSDFLDRKLRVILGRE